MKGSLTSKQRWGKPPLRLASFMFISCEVKAMEFEFEASFCVFNNPLSAVLNCMRLISIRMALSSSKDSMTWEVKIPSRERSSAKQNIPSLSF